MRKSTEEEWSDYFDVADEIWPTLRKGLDQTVPSPNMDGLTLSDLDDSIVASVAQCAANFGWPWPPELPWAEEATLDRINQARVRRQEGLEP
jgi:hypothetical protein